MTESYGLFDAADPEAPDRVYTSEAFARLFRTIMRDGIVHNDGDELAVSPTVPAAMSVDVGTGMALVQGRYYINDADLTLTVEAADPSYPRIDRVVVRADLVGRTVHAVVKKGTPAPSPVPPGLTRTAEIWELSLAQVRVEAGATSILSAKITDERGNASLCGVAAPVYVPSSQLEVVGPVDMQGKALTGLPDPSGSTDAARKGYVDTEIAGRIGSFGISDVTIDGPKNWDGKDITNVGQLTAVSLGTTTYSLIAWPSEPENILSSMYCYVDNTSVGSIGDTWVTRKSSKACPPGRSGTVRVRYNCVESEASEQIPHARLLLNGTEITNSEIQGRGAIGDMTVAVVPGDIISVQTRHGYSNFYSGNTLFEISAVMLPKLVVSNTW